MSISLPAGNDNREAEADWLCSVISKNALALRAVDMGTRFLVDGASFRLHARARNTIYRVSSRFDWFLKLPRKGDVRPMVRERLGADTLSRALGASKSYGGAAVIRVCTDPPFALAATIPGKTLNRVVFEESWLPGASTTRQLETCFHTLGVLLASLHTRASVAQDTPAATTRPFERLQSLLDAVHVSDGITDAIFAWNQSRQRSDSGSSFVHGNFRLDNILRTDTRLGFLDLENCGTGSFYQDLSRPVSELLLTRCAIAFPHRRAAMCVSAFLGGYRSTQPYQPVQLWDHVGVRLARYYLETRAKRFFQMRVGGLPVMRTKLDRLTLAVLGNPFESVVPEIGL